MDKSPTNAEGRHHMSDVAMAREYVQEIGGSRAKVAIGTTLKWLVRLFPHRENPKNQWTERRVRSFWNEEAATVQFREMVELHRAAEAVRDDRAKKRARRDHAAYREETARLSAMVVIRAAPRDGNVAP